MDYTLVAVLLFIILFLLRIYIKYKILMKNSESFIERLEDNPNICRLNRKVEDYSKEELFTLQLILEDVLRVKNILKTNPNKLIIIKSKERLKKIYKRILFRIEDLNP